MEYVSYFCFCSCNYSLSPSKIVFDGPQLNYPISVLIKPKATIKNLHPTELVVPTSCSRVLNYGSVKGPSITESNDVIVCDYTVTKPFEIRNDYPNQATTQIQIFTWKHLNQYRPEDNLVFKQFCIKTADMFSVYETYLTICIRNLAFKPCTQSDLTLRYRYLYM